MNEIEVGRLVYIVERALFRRLIRPRYNKRQGYRALMRLLTHYRGKVTQLEAELRSCLPKVPEHEVADSAQWWHEKYKELEAENERLKALVEQCAG